MQRVAIVTGSRRGIGATIADRLEQDGYRVIRNGRLKGKGKDYIRADVTTKTGARRLVAAAPRCDLLVNNVGDFEYTPVSDFKLDEWEDLYTSNLRSVWMMCRETLPVMRKQQSGAIINMGGPVSQTVRGNSRAVGYAMAKTALVVFTKSLARAEAPNNIRINMINPGFILTDAYTQAEVDEMAPAVPAGRIGEPEDISEAALYLASPQANYVNGAVLDVGGGLWV